MVFVDKNKQSVRLAPGEYPVYALYAYALIASASGNVLMMRRKGQETLEFPGGLQPLGQLGEMGVQAACRSVLTVPVHVLAAGDPLRPDFHTSQVRYAGDYKGTLKCCHAVSTVYLGELEKGSTESVETFALADAELEELAWVTVSYALTRAHPLCETALRYFRSSDRHG